MKISLITLFVLGLLVAGLVFRFYFRLAATPEPRFQPGKQAVSSILKHRRVIPEIPALWL